MLDNVPGIGSAIPSKTDKAPVLRILNSLLKTGYLKIEKEYCRKAIYGNTVKEILASREVFSKTC